MSVRTLTLARENKKINTSDARDLVKTHIKEGAVVMRLNLIKRTKKGHKHEDTWMVPTKCWTSVNTDAVALSALQQGKISKQKSKLTS